MESELEKSDPQRYIRVRDNLDKAHKAFFPPHVGRNFRKGCAIVARKKIAKFVGVVSPRTLVLYWRTALIDAARKAASVVSFKDNNSTP